MVQEPFDPVTLTILWQRLITVADQMATTLARTAFSNTIAAANDFGCVLMDARGHCVAHANRSLPIFNRTVPHTTRILLQKIGHEFIRPGDVFISNDPWLNAGHQPDVTVITPFFHGGRLRGFSASIAHHADVGGTLDSNNAREVYEEGLIIPMVHLYKEGRRNDDVFDLITANVRLPEMFVGDIHAQVAANQTGTEKLQALMTEYGLETFQPLADEIQRRSEDAMRASIRSVPDGDYSARVYVDELDRKLHLDCRIRVQDDALSVSFDGTSPQQPRGGINVTETFTNGQASYALKCTLLPDIPGNAGCYKPLAIQIPPGSVLNARRPASVRQRHRVGAHVFGAVLAALSEVLPERVIAGSGFLVTTNVFAQGTREKSLFHSYSFNAGGMGGSARADGISACQCPALAANVPVELFEVAVPLLVEQRSLITDSGGPGRYRGGLGQRVAYRLLPGFDGEATVSIWAAGQNIQPFGLEGGRPGTAAQIMVDGNVLTRAERVSRTGALGLENAETVVGYDTAAGGGYGRPEERAAHLVQRDVRDGLVSRGRAAKIYGVVLDAENLTVDVAATSRRRAATLAAVSTEQDTDDNKVEADRRRE